VAIAVVGLEYNRQRKKDMAKAAKEKAYQDKVDDDTRVRLPFADSMLLLVTMRHLRPCCHSNDRAL
jgi:hypothetical protein